MLTAIYSDRVPHLAPYRPAVRHGPLRHMSLLGDTVEFKVTAVVVSLIPPLAQIDPNNLVERSLLATCGGLGALLALLGDKPKSWQDVVWRIVGGIVSCFLFGPSVAQRFGLHVDMNGIILTFGLTGVLSWYILGAVTKLLIAWRDSGGLGNAIRAWFTKWASLPSNGNGPSQPPPK